MKKFLRRIACQRVSPLIAVVGSLILAGLMVLADADQMTCFIALIFLISMTDRNGSCRLRDRAES